MIINISIPYDVGTRVLMHYRGNISSCPEQEWQSALQALYDVSLGIHDRVPQSGRSRFHRELGQDGCQPRQ